MLLNCIPVEQQGQSSYGTIDIINKQEDELYEEKDLPELGDGKEIDSNDIQEAVGEIDQKFAQMPKNKQLIIFISVIAQKVI